jgi:ABC-type glycerol-3-phosphate transport system substrate-binding protein
MRRHRRNHHGTSRWLFNPFATVLAALAVALLLAGCAEKPQDQAKKQAGTTVTWDTRPWEAERTPYAVPGLAKGNQAAYDDALKQRTQGQNEYVRIGASR